MLYQFTMSVELANAEPVILGLRFLVASDTPSSAIDYYITSFYVCLCLKTPYFIYIAQPQTPNSGQQYCTSHLNEAYLTHTGFFSVMHLTAFWHSKPLDSISVLGAILLCKITQKSTKDTRNMSLNILQKRTLAYSARAERRRSPSQLFDLSCAEL